jgi:hypothetical protein
MKNKFKIIVRSDESGLMFGVYFEYKGIETLYKKYKTYSKTEHCILSMFQ